MCRQACRFPPPPLARTGCARVKLKDARYVLQSSILSLPIFSGGTGPTYGQTFERAHFRSCDHSSGRMPFRILPCPQNMFVEEIDHFGTRYFFTMNFPLRSGMVVGCHPSGPSPAVSNPSVRFSSCQVSRAWLSLWSMTEPCSIPDVIIIWRPQVPRNNLRSLWAFPLSSRRASCPSPSFRDLCFASPACFFER